MPQYATLPSKRQAGVATPADSQSGHWEIVNTHTRMSHLQADQQQNFALAVDPRWAEKLDSDGLNH